MNRSSLGMVLAFLALAVSGIALGHHSVVNVPGPVQKLGGTSPEIASPYVQWGGINHWAASGPLTTGTTTVCKIQSPAGTSTLRMFAVRVGTATTSATTWTFAKNTDGSDASTTLISTVSLAGTAQGTLVASTTVGTFAPLADQTTVFSPNTYAVVTVAGLVYNAIPSVNFGGVCEAEFNQI